MISALSKRPTKGQIFVRTKRENKENAAGERIRTKREKGVCKQE